MYIFVQNLKIKCKKKSHSEGIDPLAIGSALHGLNRYFAEFAVYMKFND